MDGFFNVNKEKGMTSFDVCNKIRHIFNTKKVGHTGTLDPNATGVMQVAIGKATKLISVLEDHIKVYEPTVKFGILTDTLDPEGEIKEEMEASTITIEAIDNAILEMMNQKEQVPPMYSAIKVNGKKMYELAREGKTIELAPRPIKIYEAARISDFFYEDGKLCVKLRLKVSKGFYVRSYVRDLALRLNNIAIMSDLVRIETGNFNIINSKHVSDLTENDLIPIEEVLSNFERLDAKEYLLPLIKNGVWLDERQIKTDKPFTVYINNKLLALYQPKGEFKYQIVCYFGD